MVQILVIIVLLCISAAAQVLPVANGGTGAATSTAHKVFGNLTGSTAAPAFTSDSTTISTTAPLGGGATFHLGDTITLTCTGCSTTTGTVTSIATTSPITGGTITTTGTIACATCAIGPGSSTTGHLATFASTNGITLADGGTVPTGTVTSIATTSPIGGGTITGTGTLTCATCVVASSPGVGIAHFAGSTQTVTSSAVALGGADVSGQLPISNVGSSGLSGTSPVTISAAGAIACATCNTSGYQVLFVSNSTTDTVSCPNNTETDFATSYTIPANYLVNNKLLRVTFGVNMTSTAVPFMGFNLKLGTTNVYVATVVVPQAVTGLPSGIQFLIQGTAVASGSAAVQTHQLGYVSNNSVFSPFDRNTIAQPVNLATNGTLAIKPGLTCNTNTAGNSLTLSQMVVEALN